MTFYFLSKEQHVFFSEKNIHLYSVYCLTAKRHLTAIITFVLIWSDDCAIPLDAFEACTSACGEMRISAVPSSDEAVIIT